MQKLHSDLFSNYNANIRPVKNQADTLSVQFTLTIQQIIQLVKEYFIQLYFIHSKS